MLDVTLPRPNLPSRWRPGPRLTAIIQIRAASLVVAFLLALGWSAASITHAQFTEKRCDSFVGKLAVRLKLDRFYSNCQCVTHSLDFSDACNSAYISIL